ncbi:MAG: hypothetical protein Q4G34_02985 [Micrococcus sp.]|nr:hypothetical protein [Micrococcus sp.]
MSKRTTAQLPAVAAAGRRAGQVSPWVIDALLGTAVALSLAVIIAIGEGGSRQPDVIT